VKLIVQPGDSILPLLNSIDGAKSSVEILIFRFDRREIEVALERAARRGVAVHALIAYTNRGGEKRLRQLEMRFLEAGITVSRTSNDLVRYHAKMMIVDRRLLCVLGFNFTYMDIERSRSFGYITKDRGLVKEAVKLFEADATRQSYEPELSGFVVSPENSRKQLSAFVKGARKELWIYDPKISDPTMVHLLQERAAAGVDVRVIGRLTRKNGKIAVAQLRKPRLHTRTIIRDRRHAFVGSQSLRKIELEQRREVGVIFRDPKSLARLIKTFEEDWASLNQAREGVPGEAREHAKVAKKIAKAVAKELPPIAPVVEQVVREVAGETAASLDLVEIEESMKAAVKKAVKEVVRDAVEETALQDTLQPK
jgi:phosphatidylserine/phosphatidylglycerophosphate/cardiolipin synthase-like enzyme